MEFSLVHGKPVPVVSPDTPVVSSHYVDDFASLGLEELPSSSSSGSNPVQEAQDAATRRIRSLGLGVHKEEQGELLRLLGMEVGGSPLVARGIPEKLFLLYESSLFLSRR